MTDTRTPADSIASLFVYAVLTGGEDGLYLFRAEDDARRFADAVGSTVSEEPVIDDAEELIRHVKDS